MNTKMIGTWSFFIGMVLALVTAFVNIGDWVSQVLIILGILGGGFHQKIEEKGLSVEHAAQKAYDEGVEISFAEIDTGNLRVWEPPKAGEQYVIGADVAFGLSRHKQRGELQRGPRV